MGMSKYGIDGTLNKAPMHFHKLLRFWLGEGITRNFIHYSRRVAGDQSAIEAEEVQRDLEAKLAAMKEQLE
ncbi:unnamed protein product, partial [Chrysoparadoxa australica]